jgi:putative hemolysin
VISLLVIALLIATGLGTWLSALHLSIRDASRSDLDRRLAARHGGKGRSPDWIFDRLPRVIAGISLLRTASRVSVVVLVTVLISRDGQEWIADIGELLLSALIATAILWCFTSVLAAALARHMGAGIVASGIPLIRVAYVVLGPAAGLASFVDEIIRRLSGANLRNQEAEEELLRSIEDSQREGSLDRVAAEMIENVVEFSSTDVSEVMTPRTDIEGLEFTNDLAAIRSFIVEVGHSRIPIYSENLDEIRGILYVKDLVTYLGAEAVDFDLEKVLRQPIRIPETKPVRDLLADFQRAEVHLAIVIDEYGGTAGLVTIEDVLEEIVGEIQDEHDPDDEEPPELSPVAPGQWELDGRYHIDDLNEELDLELPEDEDYDTIAGYVLAKMGRVPEVGEAFDEKGFRFEVLAAEPTHIARIGMTRIPSG